MDKWNPEQLYIMSIGGNNRARQYFQTHGGSQYVAPDAKIPQKYASPCASA
jgi:ADP-ribosylation factor GTPase-activating protein 2/3